MTDYPEAPAVIVPPPAAGVLCACAGDPAAPDAGAHLRAALGGVADWDGLGADALRHGMAALLYRRVADLCPDAAPPEVLAAWRERAFEIAWRSLRMQRRLVTLAGDLAAAGIAVMAMKGPALAEQLYGDSTLRAFCDLDLLVPSAHVLRAREVMLAAGYQDVHPLAAVSPDRLLEAMQEIVFREPGSHTIVELHWREGPRFAADSLPAEELLERAGSVNLLGRSIATPALEDTALIVAVHAATHDWMRLEDVAALSAALRRLSPAGQAELEPRAGAHGCRRRLHVGVLLAVALGAAAPSAALWLPAYRDRPARRLAATLRAGLLRGIESPPAPGGHGSRARAAEIVREARGMDSWAAGAGYLCRRLVTPGVNDWEAGDGEDGGGRLQAARSAATQLRRQRRLWRR